jgi:hypothetical protein
MQYMEKKQRRNKDASSSNAHFRAITYAEDLGLLGPKFLMHPCAFADSYNKTKK